MGRKRSNGDQPIGVGLTAKQMRRKKPINSDYLVDIEPITENQKILFNSYKEKKNIIAYGAAGTGKTFVTLFNALKDVLQNLIVSCCFRLPYNISKSASVGI